MSVLPDSEILALGPTLVDPFDRGKVQPASYDLSLHPEIRTLTPLVRAVVPIVDLRIDDPGLLTYPVTIPSDGFFLQPGQCILGCTIERVKCPVDCVARVEGKSSLGRIFLSCHITAGFIDPGFHGQITLEIVNHSPWVVVLWPGMPIAQINFARMLSPCTKPYGSQGLGSHYQGQQGPTPAAGKRGA